MARPSGCASGELLQAPDDREDVRPGVRVDVRVAGVGREAEAPGESLPAEVRRGADQERAHERLRRDAAAGLHQEDGAGAGQQDHPVQEAQQAPRGLVGDRGVERRAGGACRTPGSAGPSSPRRARPAWSSPPPPRRPPGPRSAPRSRRASRSRESGRAGAGSSPRGGSATTRRRPAPGRARRHAPSPRRPGGERGRKRRGRRTPRPRRGEPGPRRGPARRRRRRDGPPAPAVRPAGSGRTPRAWSRGRGAPSPSSRASAPRRRRPRGRERGRASAGTSPPASSAPKLQRTSGVSWM